MGTGTIPQAVSGTAIPAAHHNANRSALTESLVPRNTSAIATDLGGPLGSTLFRWAASFILKITFGIASEECTIENTGNNLRFLINGTLRSLITSAGFDGVHIKTASMPYASISDPLGLKYKTFTVNSTPTLPSDVIEALFELSGGGGGGGGGAGTTNGGGGDGGAGAPRVKALIPVTASDTLTITIGSGGSGGAALAAGSAGSITTITGTSVDIYAPGGGGGAAGTVSQASQGSGTDLIGTNFSGFTAGKSGGGGISGSNPPGDSGYFTVEVGTPATGGAAGGGLGGGGGGGGSCLGAGSNGANGINSGASSASAATNSGSGGGGGGGAVSGGSAGSGGSGANGFVRIWLVTSETWTD